MDKKNNFSLNLGLGLGIASAFFGSDFFILPLSTIIVNYIALIKYDYKNIDKRLNKCIIGFSLGVLFFIVFLYRNEMNSLYPTEETFLIQAFVFLVVVAFFIYFPITRYREFNKFKSTPLSQVNLKDYMNNSSFNSRHDSTSHDEIINTINKLSEMLDNGILTQEEFDSKKSDLLSRL